MKITETVDRECCQRQDMKPYNGKIGAEVKRFRPRFCVHCGQVWIVDSEMGPAGSNEPVDKKVTITLESWD